MPASGQNGANAPGKAVARGAEPTAQAPIVLVSKRAVTERDGQPAVWVVSNGRASRRSVALGPDRIDQVEVRSGLAPGEAVVLNPPADLADGGRVRVKGS